MTRGRIKRGSKRLKTPSNSHIVERAVRIGESQQTRRSGKKGVCSKRANSRAPPPEGGGEEGASPHATDKCPEALPPLSPDQSRAGGEEAPHKDTRCTPRPPLFPCPPKGREEEEEEDPGNETPKEVSAKREVEGAEGTEPEGREDVLHKKNTSTVPPEPKTQSTRHNMALAQYNPYT